MKRPLYQIAAEEEDEFRDFDVLTLLAGHPDSSLEKGLDPFLGDCHVIFVQAVHGLALDGSAEVPVGSHGYSYRFRDTSLLSWMNNEARGSLLQSPDGLDVLLQLADPRDCLPKGSDGLRTFLTFPLFPSGFVKAFHVASPLLVQAS